MENTEVSTKHLKVAAITFHIEVAVKPLKDRDNDRNTQGIEQPA